MQNIVQVFYIIGILYKNMWVHMLNQIASKVVII